MKQAILKTGWGYWDTTHYPYGGCFKRAADDQLVTILRGPLTMKSGQEYEIQFPDGRKAFAGVRALGLMEATAEVAK